MIGKTLGHYQITNLIGKGGMGEVFQAKDQVLGRDVAIKVLPDEFARDADRVARFQREAKVLASLNHPNIAAIHGLEGSDGNNFLVLELVQGETLADRIKHGPVPAEEALKMALQISEALEAAHEKGIIHRDLKPSNIKVTPEGKVKVLDFGLAKAYVGDREEANLSNSPTLSDAATKHGIILGTAAYMAPEQARGTAVDKRADIWAFGAVLFEMLAGSAAFSGRDVTDILAAVIRSEPEWNDLPENLHWRVREVLERCLRKDPRERYHDISDVKLDLQKVLADPDGLMSQPPAASGTKSRKILPWITAFVGFAMIGALIWIFKPTLSPEKRPVIRLTQDLLQDEQIVLPAIGTGHTLAVSTDGNQFAYSTNKGLYLRSVNELNAALVSGTGERAQSPFFSPDGQWIGYWSQPEKKLKKIAVRGGAPVTLCDSGWLYGATWYEDNTIVYSEVAKGVMRVSTNGGTPETLVRRIGIAAGQILPDRKSILFTDVAGQGYKILVQAPDGKTKELFAGMLASYLPTGHLVYGLQNSSSLFAVPFDPKTLQVKGGPVPVVEGALGVYGVSNAGTIAYLPGETERTSSGRTLVWVDRDGKEEPLGAQPADYLFPSISPDATRIALTILGDNSDIWIWDIARKTMTRLTFEKSAENQPIWTPDSKQVLFWSGREGKFGGIYRKQADGTGEVEKVASAPDRGLYPYSLSRDAKTLIAAETTDASAKWDISMLIGGDHQRKPLLQNPDFAEVQPRISPDGKWLAYVTAESGRSEVYVCSLPDVNKGRWQVSANGGVSPIWSPDGQELLYFSEDDGSVTSVPVKTSPVFKPGTPKRLFSRGAYLGGGSTPGTPWDIHPGGKRFLMMRTPNAAALPQGGIHKINVILNWTEELKQRVPVK